MSTLYELTGEFLELFEMIDQGEYDDDMLMDTLEAIDGEIEIKAENYAKVIQEISGQIDTIVSEISRLQGKKNTLDNAVKRIKGSLQGAMELTGKTKFKTDLFSFGIQNNPPSLKIDDESAIPAEYLIPQTPKIDSAAIKKLLKTETVPWAHLEQGQSLRIR